MGGVLVVDGLLASERVPIDSAIIPAVTPRRSYILGIAVGVAALTLFIVTMAPGLIGRGDTPKFQFIGRVLGTAHNPGYPLYVVISHLFGLLPIANLAWRINLMSAVFAAITVALYQLTVAEVGGSRLVGAVAGLGLATGSAFWLTATVAEVYSLHACLVAAMTYSLVRWRGTGRGAWFVAAIACFSIGLGHHTSIVMLGPAVAMFAIATMPGFALAPRTIVAILALFTLGFSQYLFVMMRTLQGAWGESPASNFHELFGVIRGAHWAGYVEPFSYRTIESRGPLILNLLATEVSLPVVGVALAGVVVLARRDLALLALALGSTSGVIAFATFFPGESANFLLPAYFFLWLLAAVGLEALTGLIGGLRPRTRALVTVAPLLAMVAWRGARNLEGNDLSHRRFEMRYFEALSRQLPLHSALVAEDFIVDRMAMYKQLGERAFDARDITGMVEALPRRAIEMTGQGYTLFGFFKGAATLRRAGFEFEYSRWPLEYGPIRQFLDDQPPGTVVAFAVPAMQLGSALTQDAAPFDAIGGRIPQPSWSNMTVIGAVGRAGGVQSEAKDRLTSVFAGRGLPIGTSRVLSPTDILAEAVYDRASIRVGSREVIRSHAPVVAVWNPHGEFIGAFALNAQGRVPVPDSPLSVHRLRAVRDWTVVGSSPTDITALAAGGHVMVRVPSVAPSLVVYAGRQRPLAPRLFDVSEATRAGFSVEEFSGGSPDLNLAMRRDGWLAMPTLGSMRHVYRIELPPSPEGLHLGFGGLPDVAMARWTGDGDAPSLYGLDLMGQLEPNDDRTDRLHVARDHHQFFLGTGWSPINADEVGGFSVTVGAQAEILLPCEAGACSTVDLQLWPTDSGDAIGLVVNGVSLTSQRMHSGWNWYRWTVPSTALRAGMNSLVLQVAQPTLLCDALVARASQTSP